MNYTKKIRIAFVHDDFIQFGGAEKLFFDVIHDFKLDSQYEIKVFSSIVSPNWQKIFLENNISYYQSFLKYFPFSYKYSKFFFVTSLFYLAFADFDFSDYDFVISSSTRFGHFLITKPNTYHISYINSPSRALWDEKNYFYGKSFFYFLIKKLLPNKRVYDFYSHVFADLIITNSKNIQKKVKKIYSRNSIILFPFVNLKYIKESIEFSNSDYFILISRLVSWKRIDYVIDAFNKNLQKLIVVGDGPELARYQEMSKDNIIFKGYVSENEKNSLLQGSKALIFPQNEDFGITILEALNYNIPVIYLNRGGAKEILNSKVGLGFGNQTSGDLNLAISNLSNFEFCTDESKKILKNYSKDSFIYFIKKLTQSVKN